MVDTVKTLQSLLEKRGYKKLLRKGIQYTVKR